MYVQNMCSLHLMKFNNGRIFVHLICHEQRHAGSHTSLLQNELLYNIHYIRFFLKTILQFYTIIEYMINTHPPNFIKRFSEV